MPVFDSRENPASCTYCGVSWMRMVCGIARGRKQIEIKIVIDAGYFLRGIGMHFPWPEVEVVVAGDAMLNDS